jgi:DNA primase
MGNSDIDEIKKRLKIEEIVSEYIKLKKAGSGFTALCPFHNEKSPSFNISPDRGIYKCFGCGESGDVLEFVQKFEGITFQESLKKLAEKSGVQLTEYTKNPEKTAEKEKQKKKEERLLILLLEATKFFQVNLMKNDEAKNYLKKRGVDAETAKKFKIGYALDA